jgi:spoIIIJ-associated protein
MGRKMIKIEADTLERAYANAASQLKCSVTELTSEVVQHPRKGYFGVFKKTAIIVAAIDETRLRTPVTVETVEKEPEPKIEENLEINEIQQESRVTKVKSKLQGMMPNKIIPTSFSHAKEEESLKDSIVVEIKEKINDLFQLTCFKINEISVSRYDEDTILIEFQGEDAALLIGKEGYRYKAISYMLFNWINAEYKVQLRLEIAEFLKNQEESVNHYIENVCESIDRDGKAQTKILDGVLVQIALKELRDRYPNKYVVIRSTKDGLKYIIVNDYHTSE